MTQLTMKTRKYADLLVFFTYEEMCVHARRCARTRDHGFKNGHKSNKFNKYADLRAKVAPWLVVSVVSGKRLPEKLGSSSAFPHVGAQSRENALAHAFSKQ